MENFCVWFGSSGMRTDCHIASPAVKALRGVRSRLSSVGGGGKGCRVTCGSTCEELTCCG